MLTSQIPTPGTVEDPFLNFILSRKGNLLEVGVDPDMDHMI